MEGYWTVTVHSVQVRTRDHVRPGHGEVLVDTSSSPFSSSSSPSLDGMFGSALLACPLLCVSWLVRDAILLWDDEF